MCLRNGAIPQFLTTLCMCVCVRACVKARCRDYDEESCARGGFCNFLHVKPVPMALIRSLEYDAEMAKEEDEEERRRRKKRDRKKSSRRDSDDGRRRKSSRRSRSRSYSRSRSRDRKEEDLA